MSVEWRRWSVEWHGQLKGDNDVLPLFKTRRECRQYIKQRYGYIRHRPDLQKPPHNWRMPKPVRVEIVKEGRAHEQ